jgi:hypothetical protein
MKLPRWLLWTMVACSVVAMLVAAGWWWVTWPERTAREFADVMAEGRAVDLKRMWDADQLSGPNLDRLRILLVAKDRRTVWRFDALACSRTWLDVLCGRQQFVVPATDYAFTATRGRISEEPRITWIIDEIYFPPNSLGVISLDRDAVQEGGQ